MNEAALTQVVEPALADHGLELDRLDIVRAGKRSVVRITVDGDGPEGRGPLLDDIAEASRAVSAALDASPVTGSTPYTLEVSTRGVSAPLTAAKHFRRNTGRLVRIVRTDGTVVEDRITGVDTDSEHGDRVLLAGVSVPLADIKKAVVQVEMNRPVDSSDADDADADDPDADDSDTSEED